MWLTQMIRTPPPKQFTWNWAYSLSSQWSSQWQLEVLSEDLCPFFSHVYGPLGKVFLPPVTGSPTWTSRVHRSALNAHRIHKFSYLCPFTFIFALVIKLLCFALRTSFFLRNLLKWFFRPRTSCYFFLFWMWQPILSS